MYINNNKNKVSFKVKVYTNGALTTPTNDYDSMHLWKRKKFLCKVCSNHPYMMFTLTHDYIFVVNLLSFKTVIKIHIVIASYF